MAVAISRESGVSCVWRQRINIALMCVMQHCEMALRGRNRSAVAHDGGNAAAGGELIVVMKLDNTPSWHGWLLPSWHALIYTIYV